MAPPKTLEKLQNFLIRPFRVILESIISFNDDRGFVLSSSVSFYFILSIIPFALFAFSVLGVLLEDVNFAQSVYKALALLLARPDAIDWFKTTLDSIIANRGATTLTGVFALLFVSVGMFRSLEYAMNHVFGVRPRSYFKSYLIGIGVSLILNTLLLLGVVMSPVFDLLSASQNHTIQNILSKFPWLTVAFDWVTSVLLFALVCLILYYILPNTKQRFRDVFLGALTAGLLWEVLKIIFSWYLSYFKNIQLVYGALAAVFGAVIWVYLSTTIIIFGAEVCMVLGMRSKGVPAPSFKSLVEKATITIGLSVPWVVPTRWRNPQLKNDAEKNQGPSQPL